MKYILIALILTATLFACTEKVHENKTANKIELVAKNKFIPNPSGFEIYRGINISHWLSQTGDWVDRATFFTEKDVEDLKGWGYDHIRLPVDEENLFTIEGNAIDSSFKDVKNAIDWCIKNEMRVIVDLHILRSHHFNSRNHEGAMTLWNDTLAQDKFLSLWDTISRRLKDYPNSMVAYEFMNEPVAPENEMWNKLVTKAFKKIRSLEPERVLMLGSNRWQQPQTFPDLAVPENDKNIILTVHTYHPYFITHYLAHWSVAKDYKGPVQYPGVVIKKEDFDKYVNPNDSALIARIEEERAFENFDIYKLRSIIKPAVKKAKEMNLQLYCSEFGCLPNVADSIRYMYYKDITAVFHENNISYSNWDYKGNFGIVKYDGKAQMNTFVDSTVINILVK